MPLDFESRRQLEQIETSPTCEPGPDGRCVVCSDEGLPGQVLELRPHELALVDLPGGVLEVALDLVEDVRIGDRLLVHAGIAIAKLEG